MVNSSLTQFRALLARQQALNQRHHQRLARKIHDEVSQKLTLLALQMALAAENPPSAKWAKQCQDWSALVVGLGAAMREITNDLQPRVLDEFGLIAALQWFSQSVPREIRCAFRGPSDDVSVSPLVANELFAICRDMVTEILVPARVPAVEIGLEQDGGALRLNIKAPNGAISEKALDQLLVRERLLSLDGSAQLTGSVLALSVPVHRPVPELCEA